MYSQQAVLKIETERRTGINFSFLQLDNKTVTYVITVHILQCIYGYT